MRQIYKNYSYTNKFSVVFKDSSSQVKGGMWNLFWTVPVWTLNTLKLAQ